ncbi:MAG: glycerate kinase [Bacillota bacterium]|nr:glycerate kinase [Bacillota bacterium]
MAKLKFMIAPDKFKGSMTAAEATECITRGILSVLPSSEILRFPLSDGGEGLVDALLSRLGGKIMKSVVTGPLNNPVEARWAILDDGTTAVVEMATASGLNLLPKEKRNPLETTTYGTGELIKAVLDQQCTRLIIGIGGSATNDAGAGMAQVLGIGLYDHNGVEIGRGGKELLKLEKIDLSGIDQRLAHLQTIVAGDVDNPLTGPHGASLVYGPQKGASPNAAALLDRALIHFARMIKKDLGMEIEIIPGAGAAGGLGAGLIAFLQAEIRSGIDLVLDELQVDEHLPGCRLVVTGEGRLDSQSLHGKVPVGIARRAAKYHVPVIALTGSIENNLSAFYNAGIEACFTIADGPLALEESLRRGPELLESKTSQLFRLWKIASSSGKI